ncbi:hypothetical protein EVA_17343 [gut metagenome]|uniref:Uncharacterized protein n=1 Tax=gut metagenome TaxID=749906 RepID=J9C447_9ZZZZ
MIFSCISLSDAIFHQTRKRWQNIDRRINRLSMQISVKNNLSFCDISCQIRNRMCDIVIRHREDRKLCDRTIDTLNDSCPLINRCQFTI